MALNLSTVPLPSKHIYFLVPAHKHDPFKLYSLRRAALSEEGEGRVTEEELSTYSGSLSSARTQLDLLEQLTSSSSGVSGYESDSSFSKTTIRDQLANLVGDRDDDFSIPLGKNLKKVSAKFLTVSQKRNIRRQTYLNEVSQRNDSVFFATVGAFVILPPLVILGIAIATSQTLTTTTTTTTTDIKVEVEQESENPQENPQEEEETVPSSVKTEPEATEVSVEKPKWPGWPGSCVFRMVVPVLKVGSIIGRKGELVKKMCEETGAKIRVLDGPASSPDRIVLISGKEDPEAALSPAMDAVIRIFKRVSGLPEVEGDGNVPGAAGAAFCSIRLLVASTQAVNLIGKQGSLIKPIQQKTGASIRVLSNDEMPIYATSDEKIVELQGEALKVLKALESVIGHLRKFLVDHSVLPLFEKSYNTPAPQDNQTEPWSSERTILNTSRPGLGIDYPPPAKRETLFPERESQMDLHYRPPGPSLYGQDSGLSGTRTSGVGRAGNSVITQISQTVQMQIPLIYAEDIIGFEGAKIAYIRRTSGAILTVQESRGLPDEITVEIKGTSSQVQTAQQLIQEFVSSHKESLPSSYGQLDSGLRPSSYSNLGSGSYPSSYGGQQYGGSYGSFGAGGYSSYRS